MKQLYTPWGEKLDKTCPLSEYPRPQLVRDSYLCLNGIWNYTVEDSDEYSKRRTGEILVPFSPESLLSGCDFQLKGGETLWYERTFTLPEDFRRDRVLLHFGAVDQCCRVLVNDTEVCRHEGGYLPFTADITAQLQDGENRLTVAVTDDLNHTPYPFGKQKYDRGGIWYTAQSGIWQTVWMESVPENYVRALRLTPDYDRRQLRVHLDAAAPAGARVCAVWEGKTLVEADTDDYGDAVLAIPADAFYPWTPDTPHLYDLTVRLGEDAVSSYFGMRKFSTVEYRNHKVLALNNAPCFQSGLLDQGYWSDGLYTAPSDEAMIYDIETMKKMGFNTLRKHIKVEPLRWYYHCDRLGMLVWQDMVSGFDHEVKGLYSVALPVAGIHLQDRPSDKFGRADKAGREEFERELDEMIDHLRNCVSLCLWTPFNEGWGQFDAARIAKKVKEMDPTRPVDHASGWHDQGAGDLRSYHIYRRPVRMKNDNWRALALTEFGGYSIPIADHYTTEKEYGYGGYTDLGTWQDAVENLYLKQVLPLRDSQGLTACIYTQVSDVEDEVNGLMTYDRRVVKMEPNRMWRINEWLKF